MDSIAARVASRRRQRTAQRLTITITQAPEPKPKQKEQPKDPKDRLIEVLRLALQATEKEAASLRKMVRRAGIIWEYYSLREFNEVRFTDGLPRFVNARGDCVNIGGDYLGHFYWHTRKLSRSLTPPSDWEEICGGCEGILMKPV